MWRTTTNKQLTTDEAISQIADLHDFITNEMGGYSDLEGAVNAAIRIMREQRQKINSLYK